jgi:hypothetical protein
VVQKVTNRDRVDPWETGNHAATSVWEGHSNPEQTRGKYSPHEPAYPTYSHKDIQAKKGVKSATKDPGRGRDNRDNGTGQPHQNQRALVGGGSRGGLVRAGKVC